MLTFYKKITYLLIMVAHSEQKLCLFRYLSSVALIQPKTLFIEQYYIGNKLLLNNPSL